MALAQRSQELQSIMRGLELFGSMAQAMPVMDYIDGKWFYKIQLYFRLLAAMIKQMLRSNQIREERAAAQQEQWRCTQLSRAF